MKPNINQELPMNIEAERCLLSSVINDPTELANVQLIVTPADFLSAAHEKLFRAQVDLVDSGVMICDLALLMDRVVRDKIFEKEAGAQLGKILAACKATKHATYYAEIVADCASRRRTILACMDGLKHAYDMTRKIDQTNQRLTAKLEAGTRLPANRPVSQAEVIQQIMGEIWEAKENPEKQPKSIKTGFPSLDDYYEAWRPGETVVVGARTSVGKTQFMLQVADYAANTKHNNVLWVNLEMQDTELQERELARKSEVKSHLIRSRVFKDKAAERKKVSDVAGKIRGEWFYSWSPPEATLTQIKAVAKLHKAKHGLDMLVIDYVQQVTAEDGDNREQQINKIARRMKPLAKELGIVVVTGAQVHTGTPTDREPPPPQLNHLKECRAIADHADYVLMIYRPKFEAERKDHGREECMVYYRKVRNGSPGSQVLFFEGGKGFIDPNAKPEHDESEATGRVAAFDNWNERSEGF